MLALVDFTVVINAKTCVQVAIILNSFDYELFVKLVWSENSFIRDKLCKGSVGLVRRTFFAADKNAAFKESLKESSVSV